MQSTPSIESFKSMMFKKANRFNITPPEPEKAPAPSYAQPKFLTDGSTFYRIPFEDLFSDYRTLADMRERAKRGEERNGNPTMYDKQLFTNFTSKPG